MINKPHCERVASWMSVKMKVLSMDAWKTMYGVQKGGGEGLA